jgi:hypothetical protein
MDLVKKSCIYNNGLGNVHPALSIWNMRFLGCDILWTFEQLINIVAYRPVAKQRLCKPADSGQILDKHVPIARQHVLNNATVGLQQWKRGGSAWSVLRCYKQGTKSVQFRTGGCEERTWAREAEESLLLEPVARVKTHQAGKGLAGAVVNCGD